jgi:hypothetical protein
MSPSQHCRSVGYFTISLILGFTPALLPAQQDPSPPVAKIRERVDTVAGVEWRDTYAWLRDDKRQNPEVLAHLRAENAYTEAMTHPQTRVGAEIDYAWILRWRYAESTKDVEPELLHTRGAGSDARWIRDRRDRHRRD